MSMPSDAAVYEGRLSDGRTAAAMRVEVRLGEQGLEILPQGERRAPLVWPYGSLRSSVPLRADASDVLLSLKPAGTQTLFVANPAFCGSLRARASGLSPARQRLMGLRAGAVVSGLAALIVGTVWYFDYRPSQAVARLIPQQMRETMGRNVVTSLTAGIRVCETTAGRAALDRLMHRLAATAPDRPAPLRVIMVDSNVVNAFAAPGGRLVLLKGLVQKAESADEVAGVLAHELGHAIELHPEAGLIRALAMGAAAELVFAGSSTATNIGVVLLQLRYTRKAEREADAHAIRILKGAGISPKGFGDFFERLDPFRRAAKDGKKKKKEDEEVERIVKRTMEIVLTHPFPDERLAMVRSQPAYPATPALSDAEWQAMREMCGAAVPTQRRGPTTSPTPPQGDSRVTP